MISHVYLHNSLTFIFSKISKHTEHVCWSATNIFNSFWGLNLKLFSQLKKTPESSRRQNLTDEHLIQWCSFKFLYIILQECVMCCYSLDSVSSEQVWYWAGSFDALGGLLGFSWQRRAPSCCRAVRADQPSAAGSSRLQLSACGCSRSPATEKHWDGTNLRVESLLKEQLKPLGSVKLHACSTQTVRNETEFKWSYLWV